MSEWINIDDRHKPQVGDKVLIRIPVCEEFNVESARFLGGDVFLGAWGSRRGRGCTYKVTHWMPRPQEPDEE